MKNLKNQQGKNQSANAFQNSDDAAKNAAQEKFIRQQAEEPNQQQQKNKIFKRYSFDDNGGGYLGL